ncbi:MAG: phage holin family protein [Galactobacter sp.]
MTQTRENGPARPKNLRETVSVLTRLAPKQINDEISLTVTQLKSKGVSLAVAVALVVVGLVFVGLLVIALVVAAIAGLATVMPLWLSALLVAALFLILAAILAGVGAMRAKNQIPEAIEVPKSSIKRVKHDLGVLKDGTSFDPTTLDQPKKKEPASPKKAAKQAEKEEAKRQAAEEKANTPKPTEAELRRRLARRREHLAGLRDELGRQTDVKARLGGFTSKVSGQGDSSDPAQARATVEKIGPWVVTIGAAGAVALFLVKLFGNAEKKAAKKDAKKASAAAKKAAKKSKKQSK